ncbi:hypothetical protein PR202_ga28229 [Eleusine coracana subsp. coracana]|uniref:Uncharacterized protein n=1 Tax=Eleusine coracana subsp. coracana TaxID=191504 RepID=A0AAV5DI64_ELECO|nr:hypothetical protein PR202_ga28229 [Eleusine coracana subsp. coracana]
MGRRITVRKSTMVRPAVETPGRRLWLSVLDLVAPRIHTPSVRFYRRATGGLSQGDEGFFDGERMKHALAEALVAFYPLAGRIGYDNDGRLEINCNGGRGACSRLVPAVEYTDDISAFPLLVLQVTRFKCGGVCLGVGTQHTVSDGMSTAHLINSWSRLCRGSPISSTPSIDRTVLRAGDPPTPSYQHVEYQPAPVMLPTTAQILSSDHSIPLATAVRIFKITRSDLTRLRSLLPVDEAAPRLSTFAVVAAHV